ncbi:MAG: hypothetical protein C0507_23450 [Cyanobacteria bacterium PR.3.49]|nr:hypothetical protein [Cyanobacteria bacterium PR.3.49]
MIFLFVGVAIPMLILCSITYRATLLFFAVRDSCIRAAKAPTYTEAQTRANNSFTRSIAAFSEITGTQQIRILVKPVNGSAASVVNGPIAQAALNKTDNLYFIREVATGTVSPLIAMKGGYFGMSIPGLTTAFNVTFRYDALVENPDGLTE